MGSPLRHQPTLNSHLDFLVPHGHPQIASQQGKLISHPAHQIPSSLTTPTCSESCPFRRLDQHPVPTPLERHGLASAEPQMARGESTSPFPSSSSWNPLPFPAVTECSSSRLVRSARFQSRKSSSQWKGWGNAEVLATRQPSQSSQTAVTLLLAEWGFPTNQLLWTPPMFWAILLPAFLLSPWGISLPMWSSILLSSPFSLRLGYLVNANISCQWPHC